MKYEPYGCPVRYWLNLFGDKWSLLIIRDIMLKRRRTYGEFQSAGEGISTSVLAIRLSHLEEHGIIQKSPDEHHGKKINYDLTEKGKEMAAILISIIDWSEKHDERTLVDQDFIKSVRKDSETVIRDLMQ
jgi:DNA-binding HxlR family transcriptional regulator